MTGSSAAWYTMNVVTNVVSNRSRICASPRAKRKPRRVCASNGSCVECRFAIGFTSAHATTTPRKLTAFR